ncbi:MAG TPA: hypothetical protein VHB21_18860 [Minicystis sp.]|nr:hypothetical protein [Minicystis sp.]
MKTAYALIGTLALALSGSVLTGCYADAEAEPAAEPVAAAPEPAPADVQVEEGYRPMLYNGYVVYYDSYARPYYYYGGRTFYVPRTYVGYNVLVGHYYRWRAVYPRWYAHWGSRYYVYRHPRYVVRRRW